jgi:uncharacterized membrane protein
MTARTLFKSPFSSILKIGAGGYLLNRGITGHCEIYDRITKYVENSVNINIRSSFLIHKPRHEVYDFWRRLDNLPLFMTHLKSVTLLGNDKSHWILKMPKGVPNLSWNAAIVKDKPDEMIGWHSLPGSIILNAGKCASAMVLPAKEPVRISLSPTSRRLVRSVRVWHVYLPRCSRKW